MRDEQESMDLEEAEARLNRLVDAIAATFTAGEMVKNLRTQLKRAEATLLSCKQREIELSFLERRRRKA